MEDVKDDREGSEARTTGIAAGPRRRKAAGVHRRKGKAARRAPMDKTAAPSPRKKVRIKDDDDDE